MIEISDIEVVGKEPVVSLFREKLRESGEKESKKNKESQECKSESAR